MNEIVTIDAPSVTTQPAPKAALMAGARPRAIVPADIDQVWRIAGMVIKAELAPRELNTPEKATIAILHGLEIGLPPMMALQRITVINGRPAVWGDAVPGIALGTSQLEDWKEHFTGEGDHMVAVCIVKRKGIKTPKEATFSVAEAKRADLWDDRAKVKRKSKSGGWYEADNDSPWYRYPKRMLQMRARVAFRDLFADAFSGLYIAEELIGKDPAPPADLKDVTPARAAAPATAASKSDLPPVVTKAEPSAAASAGFICTQCEFEYPEKPEQCDQCGGEEFGAKMAGQAHTTPAEAPAEVEVSSNGRPLPPRARTSQQQSASADRPSSADAAPASSPGSSQPNTPVAGAALLSKDALIASINKLEKVADFDPWAEQHAASMEALSDQDRREVERTFNSKSGALSREADKKN